MTPFTTPQRIIITCNKRLTPFLAQEVTELGFAMDRVFLTGVELTGTLNDCIRLNLNLRCASQVLYSLKSFTCHSPVALYKNLSAIEWDTIFSENGYFTITSNVVHPTINNELFANVKVKDAIVDYFRNKRGVRPDSGPALDKTVLHLYWKDDTAEIFIDTSGETLAKHGYRKIPGKAPMLEALAAATIMATSWNRASPFINPMCGSGTVAIEAAMMATNRRPGLYRSNYAFMHILGFEKSVYPQENERLYQQIVEFSRGLIKATDISEDAIYISKINAEAAGVDHLIEFAVCDFTETVIPADTPGVVFFNPEYGERLGESQELESTYAQIGNFLKQQCKGYAGYIFTGNLELAKKIGLRPKRRMEFYTSKIDCRLLEYELYAGSKTPGSPVENLG